ncbi:RDD family protein [Ornithinimicrobium sp. W1679]|uniref:RDD family protein n=1 Tax=Ornithinimicrobium sp. W1679 TaxID=3418770 RepID=UPI003CF69D8D
MSWPPQEPNAPRHPQDDGRDRERLVGPLDDAPWSAGPPPIPTWSHPGAGVPETHPGWTAQPHVGHPVQPHQGNGPAPSPAGSRYADWAERLGAGLVDSGILLGTLVVLGTLTDFSDTLGGLAAMLWIGFAGYLAWLNGSKGQSPGKAVMGLQVVRDVDGTTLGGPVGLVRSAILWVLGGVTGGLFFVLAVLWPLWDRKNRGLHDLMTSASVVAGYPRARFGKDIFRP